MARRSWEPEYTIEDAADALLKQVAHFVQQAHDLVEQVEAMQALVGPTSEERDMTREVAEAAGILQQLERKYKLEQLLYRAHSDIKTAGQGERPALPEGVAV